MERGDENRRRKEVEKDETKLKKKGKREERARRPVFKEEGQEGKKEKVTWR